MKNHIKKLICFLEILFFISCSLCYNAGANASIYTVRKSLNPLPILSGPVSNMPWDNDGKFLEAKRQNNADVLLAGYKTVLLDPLPGEEYNVHLCARLLSGILVGSGEIFSQNKSVGPYTTSKGFKKGPTYAGTKLITTIGGGVCKVATTLYNVAVLSNLPIIERHYHSMPVSYVPYGQDASVSYGSWDFKFKNSNEFPVLIWAQGLGDTLYIGFYGREAPPKVEWHHEILSTSKTNTIYRKNPKLSPGIKKVVVEGMDGKTVMSWVNIYYKDGTVKTKKMGISKYKPLPYIIETGN